MARSDAAPGTGTDDVVQLLPDGVVVADGDGRVTTVNQVARAMLPGAEPGGPLGEVLQLQDLEGRSWIQVARPYDGFRNRRGIPEQSWLLPDGTEVLVTTRLHRVARAEPVDRVAVVLRSARGRDRLDRERSDLVATVAHELRSPLTGVKGFVSTLLSKWDRLNDEQKQLMLTTVHSDSERLSRLITELLDVARIDTGRLSIYPREVDAAGLLERVVASVTAGTARPVELDVEPGLRRVFADPDKFLQVVTNVVENALRHGEGTVSIAARGQSTPYPGVEIVVEDEGEGIPEEIRTRVFTKFWKHGTRGGSGLGLYIVHGLVRAHQGDVAVLDASGGGARIVLRWPSENPHG
ncbi:MAG: ATP-binding protein [Marmoricola sp.]